jgi:hypothetical protein
MSESSRFAKETERWVNELWNVSLFPVAAPREEQRLALSGLANIGERRRRAELERRLRVSLASSGGNLG